MKEEFKRSLEVDDLNKLLSWLLFEPGRFDDYEVFLGFRKRYLNSIRLFFALCLLSGIYYGFLIAIFLLIHLVSQGISGGDLTAVGNEIMYFVESNLSLEMLKTMGGIYLTLFVLQAILSLQKMGFALVVVTLSMFGALSVYLFSVIFNSYPFAVFNQYLTGLLLGAYFGLFADVIIRYFGGRLFSHKERIFFTSSIGVFGWMVALWNGLDAANALVLTASFFVFYFRLPFIPVYALLWPNVSLERNPFVKDELIFFSPPGLEGKLKSIARVQPVLAEQFARFLLRYRPLQKKFGAEIFHISCATRIRNAFTVEIIPETLKFPEDLGQDIPTEKWKEECIKIISNINELKKDELNIKLAIDILDDIDEFSELNQSESKRWREIYSETIKKWKSEVQNRYNLVLERYPEELKTNFDIFLSHAVVDKSTFSDELYKRLVEKGFKVWYSGTELHTGSSLSDEISQAIYACDIMISVVSKDYLSNKWTRRELNAFLNKRSKALILPIWHGIAQAEIEKRHALLLDGFACSSSLGMDKVIEKLVKKLNSVLKDAKS
ncbi:MAG: TIR domain-containing protein [Bacteroidia bacterium]|nr:TIR domain-containing protein [Bacteroidia bacterium]